MPNKIPIALYDAKPYDREYFENAIGSEHITWTYFDFRLSSQTVRTATGHAAVCVFVNDRVDRDCLTELAKRDVKYVALRCAGFNNVDLAAAAELGIRITRVPSYSPHAVAEHTVALLLTLNRRIHRAHNRVRDQNFSLAGLVGFDVNGKTVGVIGTGKIGRIVAQIFRGFGARVQVTDPSPETDWANAHSIKYIPLEDLLRDSDIITLHLPLTPDTLHILDEAAFAKIKPGAYLINTSRGRLIDTKALIQALKTEHLDGVALDVYEEEEGVFFEDLSDQVLHDDELSRLLTFPNVLITSHQAFLTREALSEIARVTTENLLRRARGTRFLEGTEVR